MQYVKGIFTVNIKRRLRQIFVETILWLTDISRGVIVIVVGNEHGDTSSNPGRNSLHFT